MALESLPAELEHRTVPALLARAATERAGTVALAAPSHLAGGETALTYAELADRSARLAALLRERGVERGDRVAILLDPAGTVEAHLAYHAAHRLGAVAAPLNTRYVERELEWVLRFSDPAAVVFSPRCAPVLERLREAVPRATLLEAGEPLAAADAHAPLDDPAPVDEHDEADWIFTSGTTGNPKAVSFTHGNAVACGHQSARLWGLDADSVYQSFSPFFTSTGCHTNLLSTLAAGCGYVVEEGFDVHGTLATAERHGTTSIFLISGVVQLLLDQVTEDELLAYDLVRLRRLCYGAQPTTASLSARVQEVFGERMGLELVHLWGLTEGGTAGTLLPPERHAEGVRRAAAHGLSIGTEGFNEWVKWRVAREDGVDCAPGEAGEICLRGPSIMDRYVDDEATTRAALRDGWLRTGDTGCVDEDGFLYFIDRAKQMIRRGGLNISSAEIEGVLAQHAAVLEAAVVPRAHPVLEQEPAAIVVLREGAQASADDLLAHCRTRLADYKVPVAVDFTDELPRNAMGRVVKGALTGGVSPLSADRPPG